MKIAIAGFGIEGRQNLIYFRAKYPEAEFTIFDQNTIVDVPDDVTVETGSHVFSRLQGYDLVIRTAGLNPNHIKTDGKIWSATNEFLQECPAPIIGVTGTKGKGTTSSFVYEILKAAGKKVFLVGNIGLPGIQVLDQITKDDYIVCEMSSFQLWDAQKSPHVAVVLMIEPDHMDVHKNFAEYVEAKANIARFQTEKDITFYHPNNQNSAQIAKLASKSKKYNDKLGIWFDDNNFYDKDQIICSASAVKLPGVHNLENAAAAISAAKFIDPEISSDQIKTGLENFHGLPHRLKFVAEINGVKFYDDSISTTPGSVLAAIKSFKQPKIIIMGGKDKGGDYSNLIESIKSDQSVKKIILMGQSGKDWLERFSAQGLDRSRMELIDFDLAERSMSGAVLAAYQNAEAGDVVILSPASSSFDLFKNYKDRGEKFVQAIEEIEE